jgi:hypothetical protein
VLGVRFQVAHVSLGMAAGTVQQHQGRLARVTGVQIAGAHAPRIEVALGERNTLEIAPDAFVDGHPAPHRSR